MIYERTKASNKQDRLRNAQYMLGELMKLLPGELREAGNELKGKLESFKYPAPVLREIDGPIMTQEEVVAVIKEASGYFKWSTDSYDAPEPYDIPSLAAEYGLLASQGETYQITRRCNSRGDIWLLTVVAMPGHVYVSYDTDRANGNMGCIMSNDMLVKKLDKLFND